MKVLEHFRTENSTWRLDIVQRFCCLIFLGRFVSKYIVKNILNNSTHEDFIWFKISLV